MSHAGLSVILTCRTESRWSRQTSAWAGLLSMVLARR